MPSRFRPSFSAVLGGLACALLTASASGQPAPAAEPLPTLPPPPPDTTPTASAPAPATPPPSPPPAPPAATEPSPPAEETPSTAVAASPGASFDDVRYRDANADRVVLGSTAETHPAGTFFFSDYDVLLLQIGYAISDSVQISVATVPPIIKDQPYLGDFGLKINLARTAWFRAAITGAFDVVTESGGGINGGPFFAGRIGLIGQACFDAHCRSSVSINAGLVAASGVDRDLPLYASLGFIANVSPLVSLLAEPAIGGLVSTSVASSDGGAVLVFDYGVRIAGPRFGVDLTLIEPVAVTPGSFDNPFVLGYPFVAFTYRSEGSAHPQSVSSLGVRPPLR